MLTITEFEDEKMEVCSMCTRVCLSVHNGQHMYIYTLYTVPDFVAIIYNNSTLKQCPYLDN